MSGKDIPEKAPTVAYNEGAKAIVKRVESQSEKFKEKARELGVEVDEEKLKRTLRKMKEQPQKSGNGSK